MLGAGFRAGVARLEITPEGPIRLSGYAARKHASTGVLTPLWAKALAVDDGHGGRIVIVTTDLLGLPRSITDVVAARLLKEHGLERSQIVFNSSHTHTGPFVKSARMRVYGLPAEEIPKIDAYSAGLTEKLFNVAAAALGALQPADIAYGVGQAGFAINRRKPVNGKIELDENPAGPVDHAVPVLRVTGDGGKLIAVLFGYACHNTNLTGDHYQISADYAGFAQQAIEAAHPGTTALFFQLCAGDQNPTPRGKVDNARDHGSELASAVDRVLSGSMSRSKGRLRTAYLTTELSFALHTRETFEQQLKDPSPYVVRRAEMALDAYDRREPVRRTPYPVQAIAFGDGPVLLALGGEAVVDYSLRAKREYPRTKLIVGAYSNDVLCYVPSKRVLGEGGYEAVDSMIYYGMPGPFAEDVEDRVFEAIHNVLKRIGVRP